MRSKRRRQSKWESGDGVLGGNTADGASGLHSLLMPLAYFFTLVYIFTIPFEKAIVVDGIGSVSRAAGIPMLVIWIFLLVLKQTVRVISPFHFFSFLFVVWGSMTFFWSRHPEVVEVFFFTYVQLYLAAVFIWFTLTDQNKCIRAMQFYLFGACIVVGFVFYNFFTDNMAEEGGRSTIAGVDNNEIAMAISLALPISWYLATKSMAGMSGLIMRGIAFAYMPLGVLAIMMTASRGGAASTIPTLVYILISLFYIGKGVRLLAVVAIVASVALVVVNAPDLQLERIASFTEQVESGEIGGRGDLWVAALEIWLRSGMNSAMGIGIGGFGMEVGVVAHNTHLSVLTETGLIGFLFYLLAVLSLVYVALRSHRDVRYLLVALLLAWGIGATSLTWEYRKPTWIVWSLVACVAYAFPRYQAESTVRRKRKRRKRSRRTQQSQESF